MGKERLSAKKITIWICVNYGIFVLGFFILGSMGDRPKLCVNLPQGVE